MLGNSAGDLLETGQSAVAHRYLTFPVPEYEKIRTIGAEYRNLRFIFSREIKFSNDWERKSHFQ